MRRTSFKGPWGTAQAREPDDPDGLSRYLENELRPELQAFEEKRKKLFFQFLKQCAIVICVFFLVNFLLNYLRVFSGFLMMLLFVASVLYLRHRLKPLWQLSKESKSAIMSRVSDYLGLKYELQPEKQKLVYDFRKMALLPGEYDPDVEDRIYGDIHGIPFDLHEAILRDEGKRIHEYQKNYYALLCQADFNKRFSGTTLIHRNKGALRNAMRDLFVRVEPVRLEDADFNEWFSVYSTDQVEARYILTPGFLERFNRLTRKVGKNRVEMVFHEGCLYMIIERYHNSFEGGGILNRFDDPERLRKTVRDIVLIYDVVKTLGLDLKTRV